MDAENEEMLIESKPVHPTASSSFLRTIVSLALFIAVDYWIFKSWSAVILLVSVIFLHESGHFIAMKIFGYKGINMTFVPFMGAYVSGRATHFSRFKKMIMLLSGPVPGILIGMALLFLYQQNLQEFYYLAALAFLLLNVFNLLPVSPLDGGQFVETLFFHGNLFVQIIFLCISLALSLYLGYVFQNWVLIIVAWLIVMRIRALHFTLRVRKELDREELSYDHSYDDLTDEHYARIRDVLIRKSPFLGRRFTPGQPSNREVELVTYVERILVTPYHYPLTRTQKTLCILVYLLAFIAPVIQWGYYKNWF